MKNDTIRRIDGLLERRIVLIVVIAAVVPAFGLTDVLVNRYRDSRQGLAQEWTTRGQQDLAARPGAAVEDFQTALSYAPDRSDTRFLLAKALIADHRPSEASSQLLTLSDEQPGSGEINLELARIAGGEQDLPTAVRYYHAAIDGAWESGATTARREARLELARLLMAHGQAVRAQAELIALIDDLPMDVRLITEVGKLLADAGAPVRALSLFRRALELDPVDVRAASLAGELEFKSGDLVAARRDLRTAARNGALDPEARDMLDVANRALALDPYVDRLGGTGRASRALRALDIAKARLNRCAPMPELQMRMDAAAKIRPRALARDADLIDQTMELVFDVEKLAPGSCGGDTPDDRALAIIGSKHATAQSQ
ncbi:MAG TPA: tetratricopeptide repeat protein [Vicinamibacterales bacterium]|nr:tetratricopeptide repeat protein [Vicinamibacterales bacterium]